MQNNIFGELVSYASKPYNIHHCRDNFTYKMIQKIDNAAVLKTLWTSHSMVHIRLFGDKYDNYIDISDGLFL